MLIKESSRYNKWLEFRAGQLDPEEAKVWADKLKKHGLIPSTAGEEHRILMRVYKGLQRKLGFKDADMTDLAPGGKLADKKVHLDMTGKELYDAYGGQNLEPCSFKDVMLPKEYNNAGFIVTNRKLSGTPDGSKRVLARADAVHEAFEMLAMDRLARKRAAMKGLELDNLEEMTKTRHMGFLDKLYSDYPEYDFLPNKDKKDILEHLSNLVLSGKHDEFKEAAGHAKRIALGEDLDGESLNYFRWQFPDVVDHTTYLTRSPGKVIYSPKKSPLNLSMEGSHADASVLKNEHALLYGNFAPDSPVRRMYNDQVRTDSEASAFGYVKDKR